MNDNDAPPKKQEPSLAPTKGGKSPEAAFEDAATFDYEGLRSDKEKFDYTGILDNRQTPNPDEPQVGDIVDVKNPYDHFER